MYWAIPQLGRPVSQKTVRQQVLFLSQQASGVLRTAQQQPNKAMQRNDVYL